MCGVLKAYTVQSNVIATQVNGALMGHASSWRPLHAMSRGVFVQMFDPLQAPAGNGTDGPGIKDIVRPGAGFGGD